MNLLFITNRLPPAIDGVGDYTFNLSREFARQGHSVSIVCRYGGVECEGVNIYPIIERWDSSALLQIERIIALERVDIALLQYVPHGFHPKGLPFEMIGVVRGVKRCGVKLFIFAHEVYIPFWSRSLKRNAAMLMMRYISGQILSQSDYLATSISYYRDMIRRVVGQGRDVGVIPIVSNVPRSMMSPEQMSMLRSRIAADDELIVSFFGLRDIKNSISALEELKCRGVKIRVVLIGKMPHNLPSDLPSDIFKTGVLDMDQIDDYLRATDILILPQCNKQGVSFKSGALAAAQSAAIAVVTAKGVLTDEQMVDRESVVFVDFSNQQSILEGVTYLLSRERRSRVGANAVQLLCGRDWESTYRGYMEIIRKPRIVISHPTGNANVRGVVSGLLKRGFLHSFHTSVAMFSKNIYCNVPIIREFAKRKFPLPFKRMTRTYPFRELGRMVALRLKIGRMTHHERGAFCVDMVYGQVDKRVADFVKKRASEITAVYCYEDCAERTFMEAKRVGLICIYDLPIGYWRSMHRLLEEERLRRAHWAMTLGGLRDSREKLARKDRELALADKIYVASSFTKKTLEEYEGELPDIEVIPYGFPDVNIDRHYTPFDGREIKLLYVGGLSQRKGIANIFEAIEGLEQSVELTVIGAGDIDGCEALRSALSRVNYLGALPHGEVLAQMASHDLLLFPSLFEGFGLVVTESMSQGTPVVTTCRTCGADIITHGVDGWIVEAGSTPSLRGLLEELIATPERISEVGRAAMDSATKRPWSRYEEELSESIARFMA